MNIMSYRFHNVIPRLIKKQKHQHRRLLWNFASWTTVGTSSIITTTIRTKLLVLGLDQRYSSNVYGIATTTAIVIIMMMSSVTTVTTIHMYERYTHKDEDSTRETDETNRTILDNDRTESNHIASVPTSTSTTTGSTVMATSSSWRSPHEVLDQNQSHIKQNPQQQQQQQNLHSPIGSWRILHPNPYIQICFDTRTRNPIYVQYKLLVTSKPKRYPTLNENHKNNNNNNNNNNQDSTSIMKRKQNYHFYEDTSIEEQYRSRNSYYHNSGYDRGHLAPAADFHFHHWDDENNNNNNHNQNNNIDMIKSTYNLCNISPQYPELNRILWNQLEQLIRQMAHKYYHEQDEAVTYVTTGPIYLPSSQINDKTYQYSMIGIGKPPSLIMVPTHFFKVVVVLDKTESNILYFACFVLPNDPNITETTKTRSFESFIVPWTDLEAVTGLTFYPDLVNDHWKVYADQITKSIQQHKDVTTSSALRIEGRPQKLFLTDGNHSNGSTTNVAISKQQQKLYKELQHLCANQACLPRK